MTRLRDAEELRRALMGLRPCLVFYDVGPEALAAVRAAAGPEPATAVRWAPEVRTALEYPALAPFAYDTPKEARRREFEERLMREYVLTSLLLTPQPNMGNVVPARPARPDTGTDDLGTGT